MTSPLLRAAAEAWWQRTQRVGISTAEMDTTIAALTHLNDTREN